MAQPPQDPQDPPEVSVDSDDDRTRIGAAPVPAAAPATDADADADASIAATESSGFAATRAATTLAPRTTTSAPGSAGSQPHDDQAGALPPGYQLHEFVIEATLGMGGFGIVYRARDQQLQRTVAIKEYMPSSLAVRRSDGSIGLRSDRQRDTFELGLRSFVNEAQLLAAFEHPALLKVYRFWEQHGSAYMVMPCYEGLTLKAWLQQQAAPPTEAWWRPRLLALADALAMMHRARCYHRDIAPDNILLVGPTQQPVLLDFGAARRVLGDATQSLTVILKPGYAPIEQYAESASLKQGAWTDVYALSAVLYASIAGASPQPSVARMINDELISARVRGAGRYSETFLAGIDAGLSVKPEQRPQDMAALIALLGLHGIAGTVVGRAPDAAAIAAASNFGSTGATAPSDQPASPATRRLMVGVLAALALGGGLAWWLTRAPAPARETAPPLASPAAPTAANTAAAPPSPALPTVAAPERGAYTPVKVLEEIVRLADPQIAVQASADRAQVVIGRDRLQFRLRANVAGHVYVYLVGTEGRQIELLFPNAIDADNRVAVNQELVLPRPAWRITAAGPPGIDHLVALVSPTPLRMRDTGASAPAGEALLAFDDALARSLWQAGDGQRSGFVGEPDCPAAGAPCARNYGASLLRIEEVTAAPAGR
ncbi:serine/threonine protein kinase [Leptothrix cholodnii SP-6]|uniref:Serine/threonine protein kinase n=1 Tax=Leptothrix cholodnii (strain ATCC 51168 / LMG 8142 / SP-6) TaxID=395495 RepID=B1XWW2_LEPCP|nr:serine/threonine-protein kinase [Leptothrix cholodnii]ACB36311.1 serine/threonine protein kinase [Leptothrix cholodnii SP-6]